MRMLIAVAALSLATAPAARSAADTPAQGPADDVLPMSALFVPSTHLPSRCDLRTHGVGADGRLRISGALPAGSNPWAGSDPEMLGLIRARILGPPRMPDGPPPGTAQARAMVTRSADGVEEGYVATYYAEQENAFIAVHAIRFADPRDVDPPQAARGTFAIGRTLVSVSGPQGACFEAIEEYLRGLGR